MGLFATSYFRSSCVHIWSVNEKLQVQKLTGHEDWIEALCYLKDNTKLASGDFFGAIKIWNYKNGSLLRNLTGHMYIVFDLSISLNNELLSSSKDGTIRIWHLGTFELVKTLDGFKFSIGQLALISNQSFACSSWGDPILIFNFRSGEILHLLFGHTHTVYSLAFLDGLYLASGSEDNTIIVWNHQTGKEVRTLVNDGAVLSLALLENGHLASAVGRSFITIWNYTSGVLVDTFYPKYSPNSRRFFLASFKMGNLAFIDYSGIVIMYALNRYNLSCKTNLIGNLKQKRTISRPKPI
jgi:WD40 repeat protein